MQTQNSCDSPPCRKSISPNCRTSLALNSQDFNINFPPSIDYSACTTKNECAYGNITKACKYSNNTFNKLTGSNISTNFDDKNFDFRCSHTSSKFTNNSNSLQNSARKERSISDRLDTTEYLLKKLNKKFNNIMEGPKINIQSGINL